MSSKMSRAGLVVALLFLGLDSAQWIPIGDLKPTHPGGGYVLTGQQLILKCKLNQTLTYNSSQLFIEKGNVEFNGTTRIVDQWTVLMNNTVAGLNYSGTYFCWVGHSTLVGSQDVTVEYYPQPVVNLTCVKYNWDEWLKCSWSLGVDYVNITNIDVRFIYSRNGQTNGIYCTNQTKTSCYWDRFSYWGINTMVTVTNTRANISTSGEQAHFIMNESVKPAPAQFSPFSATSRSITAVWSHGRVFRSKLYRLRYRRHETETSLWQETALVYSYLPVGEREPRDHRHTVSSLHPYTQYEFQLDCRPLSNNNLTTGYWSDPVFFQAQTLQEVPGSGPQVTPGSYYQQPCSIGGSRDVTVYWRKPKLEYQNGIITGYDLYSSDVPKMATEHEFKSVFQSLSCNMRHVITLHAKTAVGRSQNVSEIIIPAETPAVNEFDHFYILLSNTDVTAVWELADAYQGEISQIHIYWCQGSKVLQKCEANLQWKQVSSMEVKAILPISSSEVDGLLFGISATLNNTSSGITWAKCVVEHVSPIHRPTSMEVQKTSESTTLQVRWSPDRCLDGDPALISQYGLYVGKMIDGKVEMIKKYTYNLTTSKHMEQGLDIGQNYSFRIRALSDAGQGPLSEPVFRVIPPENVFGMTVVTGVVVAVILIAGGISICLILCRRKEIYDWYKNFRLPITVPKALTDNKHDATQNNIKAMGPQQPDSLSGLPMMTSTDSSPAHEPLQPQKSLTSSFDGGTGKTAATEEYMLNSSGSGTTTSQSSGIRSANIPDSRESSPEGRDSNSHEETNIRMPDPDTIEVTTVLPMDSAVPQGKGFENLERNREDYSLFAGGAATVGHVQHPDYASPQAAGQSDLVHPDCAAGEGDLIHPDYAAGQGQMISLDPIVLSPTTQACGDYVKTGVSNRGIPDTGYVTEAQLFQRQLSSVSVNATPADNNSNRTVLNQDYVPVSLVNAPLNSDTAPERTSGSGSSSGSDQGSSSRKTSDSVQSYVMTDLTESVAAMNASPPSPAVLQPNILPPAEPQKSRVGSGYVTYEDLGTNATQV